MKIAELIKDGRARWLEIASGPSATADIPEMVGFVQDFHTFATTQVALSTVYTPSRCTEPALRLYKSGMEAAQAALEAMLGWVQGGMVGEVPAEADMGLAEQDISKSVISLQASLCHSVSTPGPTHSGSIDPRGAYAALADATNQAVAELTADASLDTRGRVERLLEIERSALAIISSWPDPLSEFGDLEASIGLVISLLRDAEASASDDDVVSNYRLAAIAMNEEGLLDTTSQREAAAEVRKRLDLPALGPGEAL
ncbi:MAG: hypothetical protein C0498_10765 [Anaerolinea sp.]|nr:hypothetical protein [Anaerolinea sp.]